MQVQPPTVLVYHTDVTVIVEEKNNTQWLIHGCDVIDTICVDQREGVDIPFINNMETLERYADLYATRLSCRLYSFLRVRLPTHRIYVLPNRYWV